MPLDRIARLTRILAILTVIAAVVALSTLPWHSRTAATPQRHRTRAYQVDTRLLG